MFKAPARGRLTAMMSAALVVGGLLVLTTPAYADEVTVSVDTMRSGWDSNEPALAPAQVSATDFGQQFSTAVDGQVYAQPIIVGNTAIVATENNSTYGIDVSTGAIIWSRNFGAPFLASTVSCADLAPNIGTTSTPVYDPATQTVYLTTKVADGPTAQQPHWYLQGLSLADGTERPGFPVIIQGTADNDPTVTFNPLLEQQRPGLLLSHGKVYAAFGSHCDHGAWSGWVIAVNVAGTPGIASTWVAEVANAGGGGIWQSGGGLVTDGDDASGNPRIFLATGNGISPPVGPGSSPPGYLAESVVRLGADPTGHLVAKDFFSPANANVLDQNDTDLGAGGPVALPDSFGTPSHPHLIVQDGKDGRVFLLDRDNLGGRGQGAGGTDGVIQTVGPFNGVWGHPAVYPGEGGYVYYVENGGPLRAFARSVDSSGNPALTPVATSNEVFGYTSGSPVVTSSGTTGGTGLVWVLFSPNGTGANAQLRAYDAVPVSGKMKLRWSAPIGTASKFTTVATSGGRVFVGTRDGHLLAYGRPSAIALNAQPVDFSTVAVTATASAVAHFTASTTVTVNTASTTAPFAVGSTTLPTTLQAGQTFDVPVTFTPSTWGAASSQLNLATSLGPVAVDLHGIGTTPGLGFAPSPVDFGTVVTSYTKTLAVNIVNTGSTNETIQSVSTPSAPFTAASLPAAGTVLAPQTSLTVAITYAPTVAGTFDDSLTVTSTSGAFTAPLRGVAVTGSGHLTLAPSSTDFGNVVVGTPRTLSFDIGNSGNIPITISLAKAPASSFTADPPLSEGVTLGPDDVIHQQVTFTPSTTGLASDIYQLNANDGQGVLVETLTGVGVTGSTLPSPTGAAWTRNGSALISGSDLQLTQAVSSQAGSAFSNTAVTAEGMDARFQLQIGGGGGADGMSFAMLPGGAPATWVGAPGGGLGVGGLTNAVAVTFDTFQNGSDPSNNFVGVMNGWVGSDLSYFNYLATSTNVAPLTAGTHDVDINYYNGRLRVVVDSDLKIDIPVTLPTQVRPGFTAATGGLTDVHTVRNVQISSPDAPADSTPPTVDLTAPATGATVFGISTVTATASDNLSGVASVAFQVDGSPLATPVTAPYSATWDTRKVADGPHTVTAVATDAAGNVSAPVQHTVRVLNDPPADVTVSAHGVSSATTPSFSTSGTNDLLLAFVSSHGLKNQKQSAAVTGAGLTWTLVKRANTVTGSAEIWQASATTPLTGAAVKAKAAKTGWDVSITVVALAGVGQTGAVGGSSGSTGAPTRSVTALAANSWFYGVGIDPAGAIGRTLPAGQTMVAQWVDTAASATMWVQRVSPGVPSGTSVKVNDTAPTADPWNLAVVEVKRS